jgi:hypothetical protein
MSSPTGVRPRRKPGLPRRPSPRVHKPRLLGPAYRAFLAVLAGLWAVLAVVSWFFPSVSAVGFTTLGFGPALFLIGYFWIIGLGACDEGPWFWLFPIPLVRGVQLVRYCRANPERTAKPFSLAMLGSILFVLTFALLLFKQHFGLL